MAAAVPPAGRGLPPPKSFDGTRQEGWKDFAFKLKAYLNIQEPDFGALMDESGLSQNPSLMTVLLLRVTVAEGYQMNGG